jgi:hypothetical protein
MNIALFEKIVYIGYMYTFIIIFIQIKPNFITNATFFGFVFLTTWLLCLVGCDSYILKNISYKLIITISYSLFCVICFNIIHHTWKIYNKYIVYKLLLIGVPIYYFFAVKFAEKQFICKEYHTILFMLFPFNLIVNNIKL